MNKFVIIGGRPLTGEIRVSGAKNSSLPILAASLLSGETSVLCDVPDLTDTRLMLSILQYLGADVTWDQGKLEINSNDVVSRNIDEGLMRKMRASNLLMGPLLARFGYAKCSYPGGCSIGTRPMDLHLKGFKAMGAQIVERAGYITATAKGLVGTEIHLDFPSVGATENLMMAATLAKGKTVLRNAAREPEIVDLQNYLNSMGAKIKGAGTDQIKIEGVSDLYSLDHRVIPDRVEAGTHLIAAAITGGDVLVTNVIPEHVEPVVAKLKESGFSITEEDNSLRVRPGEYPFQGVDIKTMPHPGFPTDMQAQMMALLVLARGTSVINEGVFENRFQHVAELRRMGANIRIEGQTAVVKGVSKLTGATVEATDLRAGAALVLAALAAEDMTEIEQIHHVDRGYEALEQKYEKLGAKIQRVRE